MRTLPLLAFLVLLTPVVAPGQAYFQVPLTVTSANAAAVVLRFGVSPLNTFGVDRDTLLTSYLESAAPPLPPVNVFDARWVTIPGRASTYPTGLGGGVYRDFRDYRDAAQVDSFLVNISGDYLKSNATTVYWPASIAKYATSCTIKSLGNSAVPETDMLTNTSVTIPSDPFVSAYYLLIVKRGAIAADRASGTITHVIQSPSVFYNFEQGSNQYDVDSNRAAVVLSFSSLGSLGSATVELFLSSATNVSFSGTAPAHVSPYRWMISHAGIGSFQSQVQFDPGQFASGVTNAQTILVYWRPLEGTGSFSQIAQVSPNGINVRVSTTAFGEFIFGANDNQLTAVAKDGTLPRTLELAQNYPNPFNPATSIEFSLPAAGIVRLTVYDVLGRQIQELVKGAMPAGVHTLSFDGSRRASGVYYYVLDVTGTSDKTNGRSILTRKMLLVK